MTSEGDPFLANVSVQRFAVDGVVYYREQVRLEDAWRAAASASGTIGLVTTDGETLEALASGAVLVVVTAYDGDGVILFEEVD